MLTRQFRKAVTEEALFVGNLSLGYYESLDYQKTKISSKPNSLLTH